MWTILWCLVVIFGFSSDCFATQETPIHFEHKTYLDSKQDLLLQWHPSKDFIVFQIQVRTHGYVGLGFSPNGGMKGADIVLLWIDSQGTPHISDRHATGNRSPLEDSSQDYDLLSAWSNDTHSVFRFKREFDTCDSSDFNLKKEDTMRVIWAYSDTSPSMEEGQTLFKYHGAIRGTKSLFLLNNQRFQPPTAPSVKHFDILSKNVTVSHRRHTIYMCHIEKLPKLDKKHHIIGFSPIIEEKNLQHVHHLVAYECTVDPAVFDVFAEHESVECYSHSMPSEWFLCTATAFSWAIGSEGEMFPANVGVPLGGKNDANFMLVEIHYDNPQFKKGIMDNSGLRLYYTDELREHDAGTLVVGHKFGNWLMVPPNNPNYTLVSHCGTACLSQGIPSDGITVLSALLHSHSIGKAMSVQHFRDGQELPLLVKDDHYDPKYQQSRKINNVKVLPNDHLLTKCIYDSSKRNRVTWGGQSVQEEMCLAIVFYYPKMNVSICTSHPSIQVFEDAFQIKAKDVANRTSENDRQSFTSFYIEEPKELENRSVRVYAQKLSRENPQRFEVLQKNLLSGNLPFVQICHIKNGSDSFHVERTLLRPQLTYRQREARDDFCSNVIFQQQDQHAIIFPSF